MRDVIPYMSMSLDGFVGSDREHPGLAVPDVELKQWDRISHAGAHLMGRITYLEISSYWPHPDDPYAPPTNDISKLVFSKTLSDAGAGIAAIKAEPGPDVIVWGGSRLVGARRGRPDRRVPPTDPIAGLGRGQTLFDQPG